MGEAMITDSYKSLGYEGDPGVDKLLAQADKEGLRIHREVRWANSETGDEVAEIYVATPEWVANYKANGGLWY
jgi:hypothetical protein